MTERCRLRAAYGDLYDGLLALLCDGDPVGINFETNEDEYAPEVDRILPRLNSAASRDDVRRIVHEEFVRWFDAETAGPPSRYDRVADELWARWRDSRARRPQPS